ncbi:hypothetical protein EVA_10355 [gut metagenome]|uniref:Uncharacterized protein n=1 Tax=gut metagenome TaxID=749906 RepID=J9GI12_9ZZZZ
MLRISSVRRIRQIKFQHLPPENFLNSGQLHKKFQLRK